ncbi:hypothetical protein AVEN_81915-1 [Araneus ventricosus]|uniref:Uncharacterized protein n=1 Tax=Araneus ventricosus TaxID=182803 RepID=A0A4Y2PZ12_ARAVE|nr:hypothetical protein AVEN_81915-1 [Araneus ventricosus]
MCDVSDMFETRGAAQTLFPAMCDFPFLCLWNNVLKEVNYIQKYLQILGISSEKMRSLKVFLKDKNKKMTLLRKHCNLQKTHVKRRNSCSKRKNCQEEENYARRENCRRAANLGPRTKKVNVTVH